MNISNCIIGAGTTPLFWNDTWNGCLLSHSYSRLYSFAKDKGNSVQRHICINEVEELFNIPLTMQVCLEYIQLQDWLQHITIPLNEKDVWVYL